MLTKNAERKWPATMEWKEMLKITLERKQGGERKQKGLKSGEKRGAEFSAGNHKRFGQ